MSTFIGSIDFEFSIILRILCSLMFLIIALKKSFKNVTTVPFFELIKNTNLKHDLKIFLGIVFVRQFESHSILKFLLGN